VLLILSIAVLPSSIVISTISKFNNLDKSRKLIFIGSVEIVTFFVAFFILVPTYGSLGAAISTLIAFVASSIPSVVWSERALIRYISNSVIAIISGVSAGHLVGLVLATPPLLSALISITIASIMVIGLKNTTTREIKHLVKAAISGS
jgi:O-antigen/teichoic acid export membrane protein